MCSLLSSLHTHLVYALSLQFKITGSIFCLAQLITSLDLIRGKSGKVETLLCVFSVQCPRKCTGNQIIIGDIHKLVRH